jgi:two-component system, LytTR family, response regulator
MLTIITSGGNCFLRLSAFKGPETIDVNTIIRIEALSSYSKLFFANGKTMVVAKVLRWFEEALPGNFMRIHRTHLVNKNFIDEYMAGGRIRLHTGDCVEVSRRKRNNFLKYWHAYAA